MTTTSGRAGNVMARDGASSDWTGTPINPDGTWMVTSSDVPVVAAPATPRIVPIGEEVEAELDALNAEAARYRAAGIDPQLAMWMARHRQG